MILALSLLVSTLPTEIYCGDAVTEDGDFYYREIHFLEWEKTRILKAKTQYFSPDKKLRAELESDFRDDPGLPSYRFMDLLRDIKESVSVVENGIEVSSGKGSAVLKRRNEMIAGQGFHYFTRIILDRLVNGTEVSHVYMIIPSRLKDYPFRIRAKRVSGDEADIFLEVDNWLLRLFAPKIRARYQLSTRNLIDYDGPSNLQTMDGEVVGVKIRYIYDAEKCLKGWTR